MKHHLVTAVFFIFLSLSMQSQSVLGKWKTIDDETGQAKAIVEIYEKSGKIYGKIDEILNPIHKKSVCNNCSGEDKNKPILGMVIIKGLKKNGTIYESGKILEPKSGRMYSCSIELLEKDKLKIHGYILIPLLGRTQYWYRIKN